jgi:hypothetical protein
MVGIQVGNEQEERKGEEGGFEKIKDFNVSGNAGEDSRGSGDGGRDEGVARGSGGGGSDGVRRSSSSMERKEYICVLIHNLYV